ncbi:MAG: sensor domain-containing diguanylate cyclase [Deltaproteobacteria bacterium HGW-Deltaproteobacteria-22]|jgi:diguanylate cyclase (GGDEF)-like protein/PAS domain S-box-containing protein|nr:MAG: sensor domain-containing diguanylate cyclase [Deltaproteobacteria bacterium HGW-Deltaproteobacteria-22]
MKLDDKHYFKHVIDRISDAVFLVDTEGLIIYANDAVQRITGYAGRDIIGHHCCRSFLHQIDEDGANLCATEGCLGQQVFADMKPREQNSYIMHKSGYRIPVLLRLSPILGEDGKVVGVAHILRDNTENVLIYQNLEELQKQVYLDPLTGLFNRRYMEKRLEDKLDEFRRYQWIFGVLFIDVDHFKNVNDEHGHAVGDEILKLVSRTFQSNTRPSDVFGRWGGEEFLGLIGSAGDRDLFQIARRFRILVANSGLQKDLEIIRVTISVGATLCQAGDTIESVVERADQLMYQSKQSGRNRVTMEFQKPV